MSDDIKILVAVPGGWNPSWGTAVAAFLASTRYPVIAEPCLSSGPNFNAALQLGMNGRAKGITHLVTLHTDTTVRCDREDVRYADVLVEELEAFGAAFISVPNAIKDERGLTSSGVGDPWNRWNPWRRWTTDELDGMPPTFDAEMVGYDDRYLLHNNACAMWDLRKPIWWETDQHGCLKHCFNFTERLRLVDGVVKRDVDSEDWAYSRQLWQMGVKTILTTKLTLIHTGTVHFPNKGDWGTMKAGDEDTAAQWRPELAERALNRLRARAAAGELIDV